tara:strand:+ start:58 stop:354 length:297 start_codon:yes stop_codon:yes gene_type:complete
MQKTYCTSCGAKTEYSLQKPKFCSSCGEPLDVISNAKVSSTRAKNSSIDKQDEPAGDETNYQHVPAIGKLQYEVEYESSSSLKKVTLEDIKNNAAGRR